MKNNNNVAACFSLFPAMCATILVLQTPLVNAQSKVEFANGFPVAPTGLQNLPLADGPWDYRTGEDMNIHVELVARLEYAMAMSFMPDGSLLVATRRGLLYQLKNGERHEIAGGPASVFVGESGGIGSVHGYMDVKLHPDFVKNGFVYLSYTRPDSALPVGIATVGRARWNGSSLVDFKVIYDTKDLNGSVRLAFGRDGKLYVTTPERDSQNLQSLGGKVLRLNDDGSIPTDNPFVKTPKALPEIYSYGHRYSLGLSVHPITGALWQSENGPNGGDEINVIDAGNNYGWPKATYGRSYQGPWEAGSPTHAGYPLPLVFWMPSVAVSGLAFYTGDKLPKWHGDVFVGSLRTGEVNGTGHLERVVLNDKLEELRRESLLVDLHKRVRDVVQGPDGYLYLALEDKDGGVLRVMPAQ
jgi:aldose sugar dehydrogenase